MGTKRKRISVLEGRSRRMEPRPPGPKLGDTELGRAVAGVLTAQQSAPGRTTAERMQLSLALAAGAQVVSADWMDAHTRDQLVNVMAEVRPDGAAGAHWQAEKHPASVEVFETLQRYGHL